MNVRKGLISCVAILVFNLLVLVYLFSTPRTPGEGISLTDTSGYRHTTLKLRHVYHHGSTRYPKLFLRLDVNETLINTLTLSSGTKFEHTVKTIPGKTVRPLDRNLVQEYRRKHKYDEISMKIDYVNHTTKVPNMKDVETVSELAMMTYNAYITIGSDDWYDVEHKYHLGNDSFGWEEDGVRGHVFVDKTNETVVIALKGTSMSGDTVPKDKINDNRLFSCCCARVGSRWTTVCDCYQEKMRCNRKCLFKALDEDDIYYNISAKLYESIQDEYPNATVWLAGHSLGGGVSALVGLTFGVPTVAFEAPGDLLAAKRLHLPGPPAISYDEIPIYHVGHTADPIFMGVCRGITALCWYGGYAMETKCHAGSVCLYDVVKEWGWKVNIGSHRVKDVIESVIAKWDGVPECKPEKDCVDCDDWTFFDP